VRRLFLPFVLVGCFPSLDGLTGGDAAGDVTSSNDAADASSDAATSDGGADASGPFCPQQNAVLCSDFDEPDGNWQGVWTYPYAPGTTTMQESTAFFHSPPRSLLIASTINDNSVLVEKDVGFTNGLTLEFEMRITSRGGNPAIAGFNNGSGELTIQPTDTGTDVLEYFPLPDGGPFYNGSQSGAVIPTDKWVHAIYDFDRGTNTLTLTVDGSTVVTYNPLNTDWASTTTGQAYIGIADATNETVYYDDVVIRTR
jgi:hypothetical protein